VYRLASICLVSPGFPWRSLPVLALVGIAMLVIAFAPLSWRRLANLSAAFMLLAVLAAGMATTVAYLLGDPGQPHWTGGGIAFWWQFPRWHVASGKVSTGMPGGVSTRSR
jgi:hypothetical protein